MQFSPAEAKETLLARFDGITAECNDIDGFAQVDVTITESQLPDEIEEGKGHRAWVEHVIEWQFKHMFEDDGRLIGCDARAREIDRSSMIGFEERPDKTEYSVWVRFY